MTLGPGRSVSWGGGEASLGCRAPENGCPEPAPSAATARWTGGGEAPRPWQADVVAQPLSALI